jgi:hypothetical protein
MSEEAADAQRAILSAYVPADETEAVQKASR